jgi:hypothetical protein
VSRFGVVAAVGARLLGAAPDEERMLQYLMSELEPELADEAMYRAKQRPGHIAFSDDLRDAAFAGVAPQSAS